MQSKQTANTTTAQAPKLALFVSDIHLSPALPKTTERFLSFLSNHAPSVERLYILGDLFEYWAGDDDASDNYNQIIVRALKQVSEMGVELFWIAGNRDFLIGPQFCEAIGAQALNDPTLHEIDGKRFLLSHGDALCTDDTGYMQFREMVRNPMWQQQFLAKPLSERKAIIEGMRKMSHQEQQNKRMEIMDVNLDAVTQLVQAHPGCTLIHGHTHRNAIHHEAFAQRYVLQDWDFDHSGHERGGYLELDHQGQLRFIDLI